MKNKDAILFEIASNTDQYFLLKVLVKYIERHPDNLQHCFREVAYLFDLSRGSVEQLYYTTLRNNIHIFSIKGEQVTIGSNIKNRFQLTQKRNKKEIFKGMLPKNKQISTSELSEYYIKAGYKKSPNMFTLIKQIPKLNRVKYGTYVYQP